MRPNRSIPDATVVPVLIYADVRAAVAWLSAAFGFTERVRIGEDHRAQLKLGDGAVIVADVRHDRRPPRPGERQYAARDPEGHEWTFSETLADVAPEEWGGTTV
jgi:uncharacterized glyoxalase superfamily protein PhnB